MGHKINQAGIRPLQDKLLAIKVSKQPINETGIGIFLGGHPIIVKIHRQSFRPN